VAESSRRKLAVTRRCPAPLTALVAALVFGLGSQPISIRADQAGTADYSLTFPNGLAAPTGPIPSSGSSSIAAPQVVLLVDPAGGVVTPPASSPQGPLTVLAGSQGFASNGVYDFLENTTNSAGQPLQGLGLSFYGTGTSAGGVQPGGVLNFSLNVTNINSPPALEWVSNGSQTVSPFTPNPVYGTADASTTVSTDSVIISNPEPLSLLLWSALAGAGLLRARAQRRPDRVASC
jgi:hypothetical protein